MRKSLLYYSYGLVPALVMWGGMTFYLVSNDMKVSKFPNYTWQSWLSIFQFIVHVIMLTINLYYYYKYPTDDELLKADILWETLSTPVNVITLFMSYGTLSYLGYLIRKGDVNRGSRRTRVPYSPPNPPPSPAPPAPVYKTTSRRRVMSNNRAPNYT